MKWNVVINGTKKGHRTPLAFFHAPSAVSLTISDAASATATVHAFPHTIHADNADVHLATRFFVASIVMMFVAAIAGAGIASLQWQ